MERLFLEQKGAGIMSAREKSMTGKILDNIIFLSEVFAEQADRDIPNFRCWKWRSASISTHRKSPL
jgi:hypothetical protein